MSSSIRPPTNQHDVEVARIRRVTRIVLAVLSFLSITGLGLARLLMGP